MKKMFIAGLFLLLAGTAAWALKAGKFAEAPAKDSQPLMATIVVQGILNRDGVGEFKAIQIRDGKKVSALEAFFPNYRQRPTNNTGAGWMAGYQVYFDFPGGETINVTVSQNETAGSWSAGRGDFETNGDFNAFVADLVKKK